MGRVEPSTGVRGKKVEFDRRMPFAYSPVVAGVPPAGQGPDSRVPASILNLQFFYCGV
jgi:hypothetical protein